MRIVGIDPGTNETAFVILDPSNADEPIQGFGYVSNEELIEAFRQKLISADESCIFVFEFFESYGKPIGSESIETICWIGRFMEASKTWARLKRSDIKLHLCASRSAKDPHIRRVLMDRFGGDASTKAGGKLAKIKKHLWSALAVSVTYAESHCPMSQIEGWR